MVYLDFLSAESAKQMHAKNAEEYQQSKIFGFSFAISAGIHFAFFALKRLTLYY